MWSKKGSERRKQGFLSVLFPTRHSTTYLPISRLETLHFSYLNYWPYVNWEHLYYSPARFALCVGCFSLFFLFCSFSCMSMGLVSCDNSRRGTLRQLKWHGGASYSLHERPARVNPAQCTTCLCCAKRGCLREKCCRLKHAPSFCFVIFNITMLPEVDTYTRSVEENKKWFP